MFLQAYARLSSERPNFGRMLGPIPWSAVHRYAVAMGIGAHLRDWFIDVFMMLDQSYRQHLVDKEVEEKAKADRKDRRTERAADHGSGRTVKTRREGFIGGS